VFTGYTLSELIHGRWHWRTSGGAWAKGDGRLFAEIRQFLDFAVCGRFRQAMARSDKPLCGSRNQEVVFFSDRYSQKDLEPQGYEETFWIRSRRWRREEKRREDILNSLGQIGRKLRTRVGESGFGGKALGATRGGHDTVS
jgi:hypothetical protein